MVNLETDRFLEDASGRYAAGYAAAVHDMFTALVRGNRTALHDARERLAEIITATMGAGEVLGAAQTLRKAAALDSRAQFARTASDQSLIPNVTFEEAIDDLVARTPVTLRRAAERTAQRIAQLYGEGHVVAFARSAEAAVTRHVQDFIAAALREGVPAGEAGRQIAMGVEEIRKRSKAWSEGYARMAFRTTVNTAVTAGRFRQVQDPDVRSVIPAFRFDAVGDSDTRPNHKAADGLILPVDHRAWHKLAPPLGYSCRCQVSFVSAADLERAGLLRADGGMRTPRIPAAAFPDPGFRHGGRPDLFMVGQT